MAKIFIKQKVFSWGDKFNVYDENGKELFFVKGEVFSLGKKLHIYDTNENELAFIHQKVWSFKPRYFIERNGSDIAEVVKEFTFLKPKYTVQGFDWGVQGNFSGHEYEITQGEIPVVTISKRWFTWGDTYELNISDGVDIVNALAVVIVIDAVTAQSAAAASAAAAD